MFRIMVLLLVLPALCLLSAATATNRGQTKTVLGIDGSRFTVNGRPTFLLGVSYYAALGATKDFIRRDLDDLQPRGFNWLRVWATWGGYENNISAVDTRGNARQPFLDRLKWLVAECDRRGLVVDVTLSRGQEMPDMTAHRAAVATIVDALKSHRNWYLDLGNERDVRDARFVSSDELKQLRAKVRELDPDRLTTASFGGHDLSREDVRDALVKGGVDFLSPHRPRNPKSPEQTEAETRALLKLSRDVARVVPVQYQEPFRRGYTRWQPTADDFVTDLRGAIQGGAAGWCFHNGGQRGVPDERPRRSFDLRERRLMDQLDSTELNFLKRAKDVIAQWKARLSR